MQLPRPTENLAQGYSSFPPLVPVFIFFNQERVHGCGSTGGIKESASSGVTKQGQGHPASVPQLQKRSSAPYELQAEHWESGEQLMLVRDGWTVSFQPTFQNINHHLLLVLSDKQIIPIICLSEIRDLKLNSVI